MLAIILMFSHLLFNIIFTFEGKDWFYNVNIPIENEQISIIYLPILFGILSAPLLTAGWFHWTRMEFPRGFETPASEIVKGYFTHCAWIRAMALVWQCRLKPIRIMQLQSAGLPFPCSYQTNVFLKVMAAVPVADILSTIILCWRVVKNRILAQHLAAERLVAWFRKKKICIANSLSII